MCLKNPAASRVRGVVAAVGERAAAGRQVGGAPAPSERSVGGVGLLVEAADEAAAAAHGLGQRVEHLAAGRRERCWRDLRLGSPRRRQVCSGPSTRPKERHVNPHSAGSEKLRGVTFPTSTRT